MPLVRPFGFSPAEISRLVNEDVVARHAEEAAFLWTQRARAVHEPHYSLDDLAALDERVQAQLEGLRIAGDVGWKYCKANLESLGPGEVFAASVIGFVAGDRDRMGEALQAGCASPKALPGLVSALGWLDSVTVAPWIGRLLLAKVAAHRGVGIAASAVHRTDPGATLAEAIADSDPVLRNRALRSAGELKRHDLTNQLRAQLRGDDETSRFWAAWGLVLNGEQDGLHELTRFFERPDVIGRRALNAGLRAMPVEEARLWISALARRDETRRAAVMGAGIIGDPTSIQWLIRTMELPELARLAGEAFTMITGVDLSYADLNRDPPVPAAGAEDIDQVLDLDYESNLPWPSPEHVQAWWQKHHDRFSAGQRYLGGQIIETGSLREVLKTGKQRLRVAAALELALRDVKEPLFEVRARGNCQQRALESWNS